MDDYKFDLAELRDEVMPERDGRTMTPVKVARFFLGKHGPFLERLPVADWNQELERRVTKLRAELQALPR